MIKENKIVIVSGGFDTIHQGHIKMLNEAAELGDMLFVILNNDNWLLNKKGFCFMNETERQFILENIVNVDSVFLTKHRINENNTTVCDSLKFIHSKYSDENTELIFANGGDRKAGNVPEYEVCAKLGIKMVFGIGGKKKIQSSRDLIRNAIINIFDRGYDK